ncbi:MAG TPA: hypothetical protein VH165_24455 [Kofleriaceae bacterium]|jgi:hypothetical protein|nr:hypothetical protein [Kofleriaceae bacterium]
MYYPSGRKSLDAKIQAPFVLAQVRALRSSIFKSSPEVQRAITIADKIEQSYDLSRGDLFIPALETFCAVLEPFSQTILTGTMRRVGYEIFPQYVSILGIAANNVKVAMDVKTGADLVRLICGAYASCVLGPDAGALTPEVKGVTAVVTDTTFMPCQLQMGVFLGAAKLTGLFRETALVERRCRSKGDSACVYDFTL